MSERSGKQRSSWLQGLLLKANIHTDLMALGEMKMEMKMEMKNSVEPDLMKQRDRCVCVCVFN